MYQLDTTYTIPKADTLRAIIANKTDITCNTQGTTVELRVELLRIQYGYASYGQ